MIRRAPASGIVLTEADAAIAKGMLRRGDRQHDIAAWFGVNGGRIAEIATGYRFDWVEPADEIALPTPGPYLSGRESAKTVKALEVARRALDAAEEAVRALARRAA